MTQTSQLTFEEFSRTNRARCERWHPGFPVQDEWTIADWSNALAGEVGELANFIKKIRRLDTGHHSRRPGEQDRDELVSKAGKEIGDVLAYLDLLATRLGLSLELVSAAKFNEVSDREGFPERLPGGDCGPSSAPSGAVVGVLASVEEFRAAPSATASIANLRVPFAGEGGSCRG